MAPVPNLARNAAAVASARLGYVLGDDGLPAPELVGVLAAHVADRMHAGELAIGTPWDRNTPPQPDRVPAGEYAAIAADLAHDARIAKSARDFEARLDAAYRLLASPHILRALVQTPDGPLTHSVPGRIR